MWKFKCARNFWQRNTSYEQCINAHGKSAEVIEKQKDLKKKC